MTAGGSRPHLRKVKAPALGKQGRCFLHPWGRKGGRSRHKKPLTKEGQGDNMKLTSHEVSFMYWGRSMKTILRELRTAEKMTQQQLADRVHVSARTIISIEKGQYSPSLMLAYRMAEVFGVSVEELCCLRENRELEDAQYEDL